MKKFDFEIEHLYENGNVDENMGFLCLYVEGKGRKTRFHEHEFYEFFIALNSVRHYINGKYDELERGDVVFIKPSDIHGIIYDDREKNDIINFSFSKEIMGKLIGYLDVSQTALDNMENNRIRLNETETLSMIKKLKSVMNNENNVTYGRIILFEMLTKFLGRREIENNIPKWFEDMCAQMKKKENFAEGAECMVRLSGKSREYISRCMRKYLNISVTEFLNDLRLSYVASGLISTDAGITELCYEAGFYSTSWFNKIFFKKYGLTPKEMRQKGEI